MRLLEDLKIANTCVVTVAIHRCRPLFKSDANASSTGVAASNVKRAIKKFKCLFATNALNLWVRVCYALNIAQIYTNKMNADVQARGAFHDFQAQLVGIGLCLHVFKAWNVDCTFVSIQRAGEEISKGWLIDWLVHFVDMDFLLYLSKFGQKCQIKNNYNR